MTFRAAATVLLLTLLACAPAAAAPRDRDRDRMPDRWERKHRVQRAGADHDRDGLTNRAEHRHRTHPRRRDTDRDRLRDGDELRFGWHPRRRDSDRDGIRDGRENAGVVKAVEGLQVTIALAAGGTLSAVLADPEVVGCAADAAEDPAEDELPLEELGEFWDPAWGEPPSDLDDESDEDAGPTAEDMMPLARAAQAEDEEAQAEEDVAAGDEPLGDDAGCHAELRVGALVHEAATTGDAAGRRITSLRLVE